MKKNPLKEIEGKRIRWQYFTAAFLIVGFVMVFVPYCLLIFSLMDGDFVLAKWLSDVLITVEVGIAFCLPFVPLYVLCRLWFGKLICVLNADGIHYKDGFVKWQDIQKIEYEIDMPSRTSFRCCRVLLYTKNETIEIRHAPMCLLSAVKTFAPALSAKVSKNSKWMVVGILIVMFGVVPLIPLFA